jgi:hypothetical protein
MTLIPRCERCRKWHYVTDPCAPSPITDPVDEFVAPIETFDAAARSRWGRAMAKQRWARAGEAERLAEGKRLAEARAAKEQG